MVRIFCPGQCLLGESVPENMSGTISPGKFLSASKCTASAGSAPPYIRILMRLFVHFEKYHRKETGFLSIN